jgi:hypothetical protein
MKRFLPAIVLSMLSLTLNGQVLKGTIKNSAGDPLPYSTVYIRQLRQGTTSNTKGNYEIKLPDGKFTVVYQSLGFSPEIREISISKNIVTIDIRLQTQYYEIPEIRITATGEDPAYGIMRKVIGLAPYYLNEIGHYKAEVYLKGNLTINKIPKLLMKSITVQAKKENGPEASTKIMKPGDTYVMESVNELEFTAPDKYFQRVISQQSTFPQEGNSISPMDFIQASFYEPIIADMAISPLSPAAFSHYRFKYLGSSPQGDKIINKIEVIPKRKSQQLFEGTIFIVEDMWCLHSIDLTNDNIAGKIRIQQLFIPVQNDIWMPVSDKFDIAISIIGIKADVGYGSSIKYLSVTQNTALKKPQNISVFASAKTNALPESKDTVKTKTRKQIDKLLTKDELSNRDMVKLAGLMEKESKESRNDSVKNNLEVKQRVTQVVEKDAGKKDSAYWSEIRPIPLSEVENKSLWHRDSIKAVLEIKKSNQDTTSKQKKQPGKFGKVTSGIAFGHNWSDTSGTSFNFGGLIKLSSLSFNPVDGFLYGTDMRFSKRLSKSGSIMIAPWLRYGFSSQQLNWKVNTQYRFDQMNQSYVYLKTGVSSRDITSSSGVDPLVNSVTCLFLKDNYMILYKSSYLNPGIRTEITNGFYLEVGATAEDRKLLSNSSDFSFLKSDKKYTENIPSNHILDSSRNDPDLLQSQKHLDFYVTTTYTPRQRYRIRDNRKIPMGSDWPTFSLTWKHGMNEFAGYSQLKQFDMIRFEAMKNKDLGAMREYFWIFRAGGFLDNRYVPFYDFFHFSSQKLPVLLSSYRDAFMLTDYYSLSSNKLFAEAHAKYTTPYLVLKLLPGLSQTLIRENVNASILVSGNQKIYSEVGYSLSEIFFMGEVGVYAGFENAGFKSAGVKVVLTIR